MKKDLKGIYAAVVTPFDRDGNLQAEAIIPHLKNLADRGCHGVLVSGTTGEGPSLTVDERIQLFKTVQDSNVNLRVMAGTGAASINDAVKLTETAFDMGCDTVVVIPPFFFPNPTDEGLYRYYHELLVRAVPSDGAVLLYHNPMVSAPPISIDLMKRLRDDFPRQVVGIKDSSQSLDHALTLIKQFDNFDVFVGDDRLLSRAISEGGAGAMTSMANLFPDLLRAVYDAASSTTRDEAQSRLDHAYSQLDGVSRIPAIKRLLAAGSLLENETVRPPLNPISPDETEILNSRFHLHLEIPEEIDLEILLGSGPD